jgi:hypothetical protein
MAKGYLRNVINEGYAGMKNKSYRPVMSEYIYFVDDQEMYLNKEGAGYRRLGGPDQLGIVNARGWKKVRVAVGENISELVPGNDIDLGTQSDRWFVVDNTFPKDHSFDALVAIK